MVLFITSKTLDLTLPHAVTLVADQMGLITAFPVSVPTGSMACLMAWFTVYQDMVFLAGVLANARP